MECVEELKKYFEKKREDVAFAFLFGSQARGSATKLSDVDIAVYFYPPKRYPIEYGEETFYPNNEDKIWVGLRNIFAHEYLDIRWVSIKRFIQKTKHLYKDFLKKVKKYLKKQLETNSTGE